MYPSSILRLTNFEWHKWRARLCPCCPCSIPGIPPHTQSLQLCRWPLVGHQQRPPAVPLGTLATCEGIRIKIKCNLSLDSWSFWPQHQVLHGSAALRLNPPPYTTDAFTVQLLTFHSIRPLWNLVARLARTVGRRWGLASTTVAFAFAIPAIASASPASPGKTPAVSAATIIIALATLGGTVAF